MRLGGVREIEIDLRVVAATNRDLDREVAEGRFRKDLLYRLNGAVLVLPPLRDRPRELTLLIRAFLEDACARLERGLPTLSAAALTRLHAYEWPGNVRELKNAIDFAAAAADEVVGLEQLPERMVAGRVPAASEPAAPGGGRFRPISDEIEELERMRFQEALAAAGGVKAKAARLIGMPLRTFVTKLKQHGIAVGKEEE
jgi:DNA-binding NtrC family response regulator